MVDKDFFIIMDRLHGTLDLRINKWYHEDKRHHGHVFGLGKNKKMMRELMIERMTIAYDLAAAFMYLHENRLVYRDIKPENIGFDIRGNNLFCVCVLVMRLWTFSNIVAPMLHELAGDVKVFDFGLCKSLSSKLKARGDGYGYRLTGRAGSRTCARRACCLVD